MITGAVNARLDACIPLFVEDGSGQTHPLEAVIDTGFSGFLAPSRRPASLLGRRRHHPPATPPAPDRPAACCVLVPS